MTDHTPEPCGCRVALTEAGTYLGAITYCPTHAAAPALLAALEAEGHGFDPVVGFAHQRYVQCQGCAALAQAKEDA